MSVSTSAPYALVAAAMFLAAAPVGTIAADESAPVASSPTVGPAAAPPFAAPGDPVSLPPDLLKIQQSLGGSVINQFPSLQPAEPARAPSATAPANAPIAANPTPADVAAAVAALREAAVDLDDSANRLERFELYQQADALRTQAQRLREDARRFPRVAPAEAENSVAPSWEFAPIAPGEAPPTEPQPRRFGWEIRANPQPAKPDDRQIGPEPEVSRRESADDDRG